MKNYIRLNTNSKDDCLAINFNVFKKIALQSIKEIPGILEKDAKLEKAKPTIVIGARNNNVIFKYNLLIDADSSKELIEKDIRKSLSYNLLNLCDQVPDDVSFNFIISRDSKSK